MEALVVEIDRANPRETEGSETLDVGTLEALVEAQYLRKLPKDPMTGGVDWVEVFSEPDPDRPGEPPGVYDLHSASEEISSEGNPYSEW